MKKHETKRLQALFEKWYYEQYAEEVGSSDADLDFRADNNEQIWDDFSNLINF